MEGVKLENRTHAPVDFDTAVASTITSHDAGYINKALEKVVGLQTEAPLKRALIPFGGIKMIEGSCKAYNRELDPMIKKIFTEYRKTHNQGVFDVYTPDILRCRKSGVQSYCRCLINHKNSHSIAKLHHFFTVGIMTRSERICSDPFQ